MSVSSKQQKQQPVVASLAERRRMENNKLLQVTKPLELRIQELEADALRLIDHALDLEQRMESQERHMMQLLKALHD